MLGLDAAGKTTILYQLKMGEAVNTMPTIGFNVESVQYKKLHMMIWDVGGQEKIRQLWRYYFEGSHAIIFVVDAHDRDRLDTASEELYKLLANDELRFCSLLIFANKQDLPNAVSSSYLAEKLKLNSLDRRRDYFVQSCCAVSGAGIYEGMEWLSESIERQQRRRATSS
jgi:ADP-ribosylation factor 1/2